MKSITKAIAELRQLDTAALVERYTELFGRPPRIKHREWLWKRISWEIQARRLGGLSTTAKRRLEELIAELDLPLADRGRTVTGKLKSPRKPSDPPVGAVLVRRWRGQELRLTVVETGFELDGVVHSSLSAAAHAATGSKWNGRLFWRLTTRRKQP